MYAGHLWYSVGRPTGFDMKERSEVTLQCPVGRMPIRKIGKISKVDLSNVSSGLGDVVNFEPDHCW